MPLSAVNAESGFLYSENPATVARFGIGFPVIVDK